MKQMHRHAGAFVVVSLGLAPAAQAQVAGRIEARLQIDEGCEVTSGGDGEAGAASFGILDFGPTAPTWTDALGAELTATGETGTLQVTCSPGVVSFTVAIDGGLRGDRTLLLNGGSTDSAADIVGYELFADAARTLAYPIGTPRLFSVAADGQPVDVPLFGAIPPNAAGAKTGGLFTDTLLVTIDL